ncbi:fibronectin type III domain-containing protein [Actinoplanes sp. NPDC049596]|uniref:fibronectin type III domain-containing protein n=1 Tax=unclassified Actinoplanes TaxID=2626549 RepID=UPI00341F81FA
MSRSSRRRRTRLPLVVLGVICLVAGAAAVAGASPGTPGLRFAHVGRWFADPWDDRVFHVDGMSRTIDAQVTLEDVEPGTEVVEGERSSYVIGPDDIRELDKSSLALTGTTPSPAPERPVTVDAAAGPYAVYRETGQVVRLGPAETVIEAGGPLGAPVVTPDGTLWLYRGAEGLLCHLAPGADRVTCPVQLPAGHAGGLSVLGDTAVFLDFSGDTMTRLALDGPGRTTATGVDLPPGALVAPGPVGGRIAVVARGELLLLDADGLAGQVALPPGRWAAPVAGRSSIVLLELGHRRIHTYDPQGRPRRVTTLPAATGDPVLRQGQDGRVYVQSGDGRHVSVVDDQGGAAAVTPARSSPAAGPAKTAATAPGTRSTTAAAGTEAGTVPETQAGTAPGTEAGTAPTTATGVPATTAPPVRQSAPATLPPPAVRQPPGPVDPGPPVDSSAPGTTLPEGPPPPPAERPGVPPGLSTVARGAELILSWGAAPPNGAPVTAYEVTWEAATGDRGSLEVGGDAREAVITGLARVTPYGIKLFAKNQNGRSDAAAVEATMPATWVTVGRGPDATHDDDCVPPRCGYILIELFGFPPRTSVKITPYTSGWGKFNSGARLTTDDQGHLLVDDRFPINAVGQLVWVEIGGTGVESNRFRWPERGP